MSWTREDVLRRLELHEVEASVSQVEQFARYLSLLRQWNARMNLTTLASGDAAIDRLIVEPALAARSMDATAVHLIDIGSGGGSPAVPLKIMRPDVRLTMVEARTRKSVFLREVARHLALEDTVVETSTYERVFEEGRAAGIDIVSVRAVKVDAAHLDMFARELSASGQILWFVSGAQ